MAVARHKNRQHRCRAWTEASFPKMAEHHSVRDARETVLNVYARKVWLSAVDLRVGARRPSLHAAVYGIIEWLALNYNGADSALNLFQLGVRIVDDPIWSAGALLWKRAI
jgi:hypothetical protein